MTLAGSSHRQLVEVLVSHTLGLGLHFGRDSLMESGRFVPDQMRVQILLPAPSNSRVVELVQHRTVNTDIAGSMPAPGANG